MGYIEKVLGDTERVVYRAHKHVIVLLRRCLGWFLAFVVLLGLGLTMLLTANDEVGVQIRFAIGVVVLASLVVPLFLIIRAWRRGYQGRDLLAHIWLPILAALCIIAVALFLMLRSVEPETGLLGWIGVVLSFAPLGRAVRIFLEWLNERYLITNRRVMEVMGIINKHVRDSALEKVNDVDLKQSFVGRILKYGTVQIITGSDIGLNRFEVISNPVRFKRAMLNAKEQLSGIVSDLMTDGRIVAAAPAAAAGAVAGNATAAKSIPELIQDLAELRDKGVITDAEFEKGKRELLSRL